jgi:peptidoglycan hydrolase-like protein with peptidoglycan-binding domain
MKRTLTSLAAAGLVAASTAAFAADTPATNNTMASPAAPAPVAQAPSTQAPTAHAMKHTKGMHQARHMSRRTVEEMQTALKASGASITVDGVWGPKTQSTLRAFQTAHNLKPTGHLDRATAEKLNMPPLS